MKRRISPKAYIISLFLFLSLAPFFWYSDLFSYKYIGGGDFISLVNIQSTIFDRFYTYGPYLFGGMDYSFVIPHLFPFYVFYLIFSLFNVSSYVTTLFFVSAIIFLSQLGMYFYLSYIVDGKLRLDSRSKYAWITFGAILYGFSPYIISLIHPGHILLLISYALFPFILTYYDKLLTTDKNRLKHFLLLSLLLFSSASAFANIGVLYTLIIVLAAYTLFVYLAGARSIKRAITVFLLFLVAAFMSNLWWMLPYGVSFGDTVALNEASGVSITESISNASQHANIGNIFLNKAESLLYASPLFQNYTSLVSVIIYIFLFIFFVLAVLRIHKLKYLAVPMGMILIGIFITKGTQEPFSDAFLWMYSLIPGFQIFRRPVSKFFWVFSFFYIVVITVGFIIAEEKFKGKLKAGRPLLLILVILISTFLIGSFVKAPPYERFNIPTYYYDAATYLENEKASRVLLLPSTDGLYPQYSDSVNNYNGVDFLEYIWRVPQIAPDKTDYSIELPYKNKANILLEEISSSKDFCSSARDLGLSHIIIRHDLKNENVIKQDARKVSSLLYNRDEIATRKEFTNNNNLQLEILTIDTKCRGEIIASPDLSENNYTFNSVSPVAHIVSVKDAPNTFNLHLNNNYSKSWQIYSINEPITELHFLKELSIITQQSLLSSHYLASGYANGWEITSKDNTNNPAVYLIYYKSQSYFYIGVLLTALYFSLLFFLLLLRSHRVRKK
jgi:hypothetical protein